MDNNFLSSLLRGLLRLTPLPAAKIASFANVHRSSLSNFANTAKDGVLSELALERVLNEFGLGFQFEEGQNFVAGDVEFVCVMRVDSLWWNSEKPLQELRAALCLAAPEQKTFKGLGQFWLCAEEENIERTSSIRLIALRLGNLSGFGSRPAVVIIENSILPAFIKVLEEFDFTYSGEKVISHQIWRNWERERVCIESFRSVMGEREGWCQSKLLDSERLIEIKSIVDLQSVTSPDVIECELARTATQPPPEGWLTEIPKDITTEEINQIFCWLSKIWSAIGVRTVFEEIGSHKLSKIAGFDYAQAARLNRMLLRYAANQMEETPKCPLHEIAPIASRLLGRSDEQSDESNTRTAKLISYIEEKMGLSDAQLAARLKTSESLVVKARTGRAKLPMSATIELYDVAGFAQMRKWLLALIPEGDKLQELNNKIIQRTMDKKAARQTEGLRNEIKGLCGNGWGIDELVQLCEEFVYEVCATNNSKS